MTKDFITTSQFRELSGLAKTAANDAVRRCFEGQTWRGVRLNVIVEPWAEGRSGKRYLVAANSLPTALRDRLNSPELPDQLALLDALENVSEKQRATAILRREIVLNAQLNGVAATAAMVWQTDAGPKRFGEATIYEWQRKFMAGGVAALVNKNRADKHARRHLISRAFDTAFLAARPGTEKRLKTIATKIERHAGSMFRSSLRMSERVVARSCSQMLFDEALKAGLNADETTLQKACTLSRDWTKPFAVKKHLATYEMDRKTHDDKSRPRIPRAGLCVDGKAPMELVHFDVHPVDIRFLMVDGGTVRVRLIGAQDHATRRLYGYPVFLAPSRGVRQSDAAEMFLHMSQDQLWGMPRSAYLDNGGEYNIYECLTDPMMLASLPERQRPIIKARPYNGSAKIIEGAFGKLERILAGLPGWIGGDRMNQKIQTVGRPAKPFGGTPSELRQRILEAIQIFNGEPMVGARNREMRGLSPDAVFNAAVEGGWRRIDIPAETLLGVFSKVEVRTVRQGAININGERYTSDALAGMFCGEKVVVRVPILMKGQAVMIEAADGRPLGVAKPDTPFDPLDQAGARESRRRNSLLGKRISAERRDTPKIDTHAARLADAKKRPQALIPDSGGTIRLSDAMEANTRELSDDPRLPPHKVSDRIKKLQANPEKAREQWEKSRRERSEAPAVGPADASERHQN